MVFRRYYIHVQFFLSLPRFSSNPTYYPMKQEEILSFFKARANEIIYKYAIRASSTEYDNQHLRMSSYFGQFNENVMLLEKELDTETTNVLSNYMEDDMDIPTIIDQLCAYSKYAKLRYISCIHP